MASYSYTPTVANKTQQDHIDSLPDVRNDSKADNLLHTARHKTLSGHNLEFNDNEGVEHITLQHRSGSILQMQPDGSVRLVSQNGKMGIEINGEGYVKVTGLYNIQVTGDMGIRVDGDMDWHVGGDMKLTVNGTYSIAAKNMTTKIKEKFELTADNVNLHAATNAVFTAGNKLAVWSASDALVRSDAILTVIGSTKVDINP